MCPESMEHAPTAALRDDLREMRRSIDDFALKYRRWPRSLQELVPEFLSRIPPDPATGKVDWVFTQTSGDVPPHVRSGAAGTNCEGVAYSAF
jgi:hypothetical protein